MGKRVYASIIVLGSGFVSSTAIAQVTTDCTRTLLGVSCETRDPNENSRALGALLGAIARENREEQARAAAAEAERVRLVQQQEVYRQQQLAAQQQAFALQIEQSYMTIISQAVQLGQCEDAKAIALSRGRLDLADQAARVCAPVRVKTIVRKKRK